VNLKRLQITDRFFITGCIALCIIAFSSILFFNYSLNNLLFALIVLSLIAGLLTGNKSFLYKALFFFIPLSVPIALSGGYELQFPTEPLIGVFSILVLISTQGAADFYKNLIKHPISKIIAIEISWLLLSSCFSELKLVSFKFTIVRICYVLVFYILMIQWMQRYNKPLYFFLVYALGFIVPIANAIHFHAGYNFAHGVSYIMPRPFFNDHTVYGACIAFLIPVLMLITFYYKRFFKNRGILLVLIPLLLLFFVAEYFSFSRAGWLSLAFCAVLYAGLRWGISVKAFIAIILVSGSMLWLNKDLLISKISETKATSNKEDLRQTIGSIANIQTDASNKERLNRWKCAIKMGKEKPLLGFGPRTYKFFYGQYQEKKDMTYISTYNGIKGNAHSEFLSYFAECGLGGMIIHFLLFFITGLKGIDLVKRCKIKANKIMATALVLGFFTYFVHGFFNGFMEEEKMSSLVFMSMAGIFYIDEAEKKTAIPAEQKKSSV
jgi:putative inorganic carbon (HCO3(-)) transporter